MSADNWAMCPRCKIKSEAKRDRDASRVGEMYGKASPEEYLKAFNALQNPARLEPTLREDYYHSMSAEGMYSCEYRCSCDVCGFSFKFQHEENALTANSN